MRIKFKFGICVLSGFLLWAIYSLFFNTEPWDSRYGYITVGLIGLVLGLSWPGKPWLWPLGHFLGQLLYWAFGLAIGFFFYGSRGDKFFIPLTLGPMMLMLFCLPALVMSLAGAGIRKFAKKASSKMPEDS